MDYLIAGLGGIGLFLLGMWLITEGLRVAAGASLARLLASWTSSRGRGLLSGVLLTALVQSSSAVTVATLGFVNTGLLRFERAVWVIFGSNVGTTLTAWLIALVGFRFHLDALALPMVGVGAMLRVFAPVDRYRNLGMALAGFGILFLGIQTLSGSFEQLGERVPLAEARHGVLWMLLAGVALTTLMQSSSAATALVLTALAGDLLGFRDAAVAVVGANIGTTSTALLASLGATASARRLAAAHVAFNLVTAVVALVILDPLLAVVDLLGRMPGLNGDPTTRLALFHTLFNVLGVSLMWPLEPSLSRLLLRRFRERQCRPEALQYIDRATANVPEAALVALAREFDRLLVQYPVSLADLPLFREARQRSIDERGRVLDGIGEFLVEVSRHSLSGPHAAAFTRGWRIQNNLLHMEEALAQMNSLGGRLEQAEDMAAVHPVLAQWFGVAGHLMQEDMEGPQPASFERFTDPYEQAKTALLGMMVGGQIQRGTLDLALQQLSWCRRFVEQWHRALGHQRQLVAAPAVPAAPAGPEAAGKEQQAGAAAADEGSHDRPA